MRPSLRASLWTYAALMAYLVLVKVIITFFPAVFRSAAQAAVFVWPAIAIFTVVGFARVFLADRTGFPAAWGGEISARKRLLAPTLYGVGLGIVAILTNWPLAGPKSSLARCISRPFTSPGRRPC